MMYCDILAHHETILDSDNCLRRQVEIFDAFRRPENPRANRTLRPQGECLTI
jgi:hypothetical protein